MSERFRRQGSNTDRDVQSTNDDAQISKLSCVKAGYFADPFVQHFVKSPSRRSPLINRGYFARCYSLRLLVDAFLSRFSNPANPCQILSLGAGYDSTWFCLKHANKQPTLYVEVDFQEVTSQKVHIIHSTPELAALLDGSPHDQEEHVKHGRLITREYSILPVDLRDLQALERMLSLTGFDKRLPTMILAECVLVYLDPDEGTKIIKHFGESLPNAVFTVYEQIRPDDAFGRQMTKNLEARGCPLRGLQMTPSLAAHEARFKENGWKKATAWDMDTIYKRIIPKEEHLRISKLEIFDEFEEWHMIQEHYCICIGMNDSKGVFKGFGFNELQKDAA